MTDTKHTPGPADLAGLTTDDVRLLRAAPRLLAACNVAQAIIEWMIDHEPTALERAGIAIDGDSAYAWRIANQGFDAIARAEGK